MPAYETIEHTADIGIRSFGSSELEVFENAAAGMFSLICDISTVSKEETFQVEVEAEDRETLLVEWLNELLYIYESKSVLLSSFRVEEMGETRLKGSAEGEKIDENRHKLGADIKAVTYHMLKVERRNGGWQAEVIFDV